jgi:hypothetical protein
MRKAQIKSLTLTLGNGRGESLGPIRLNLCSSRMLFACTRITPEKRDIGNWESGRIVMGNDRSLIARPANRPFFDFFVTSPSRSSVSDDFTVTFTFAPMHLCALYCLAFDIEHFYSVRAFLSNPTERRSTAQRCSDSWRLGVSEYPSRRRWIHL